MVGSLLESNSHIAFELTHKNIQTHTNANGPTE